MCNCRSCKPHRMHLNLNLNPNSLNHNNKNNRQQKYRARALSASPSPPPIPPQPNRFIQFNEPNIIGSQQYNRSEAPSIDIPEPPPRRYHLVPIRDENINNNNNNNQSPIGPQQKLSSFGRSSYNNNNNARHNDYENIRDIVRPPVVVKDPRRKPYYYNELSQILDPNDNIDIPNTDLELTKSEDEATIRNSTLGSGDSLDNII